MSNHLMDEAVKCSLHGMRNNEGGPFGAVVVKDGKIIAKGWNKVTSSNDPTAHAEVTAIRAACKELNSFDLSGCELYTSCEPCPMCLSAIYWARLDKIYYANSRKDAANIDFDDDFIYNEIPLNIEERQIPMIAMDKSNAIKVFEEWASKQDKTEY